MLTHKHIDKICCVILAATLALTAFFLNSTRLGVKADTVSMGYISKLFDTSTVHSIDIIMDDWDGFLDTCTNEEYAVCTVSIDNNTYKNVAIRAKGNTSLTQVQSYGNDRYSFKIEFDHYDNSQTYFGLDKLCLNNIIQDNTYMKDYLAYQMMGAFGVAAPLCSYAYITVNGEDWGLYLAVEGMEDSFLQRNYGRDYGNLYKPDSQNMGGGRGNGREFDIEGMADFFDGNVDFGDRADIFGGEFGSGDMPQGGAWGGRGGMSMGSDDVLLIYTDDEYESYSNIFDNAKTNITDNDKDRLIASLKSLNAHENIDNVVDIDSVIRYFVVHNFVLNFDSYTGTMIHNYYLYEKDGKLSMIPWDYNLAFGGFNQAADATSLVNYPIDSPVSGSTIESRPMLAWIFADETYTELYHQYFKIFISEYFDSGYYAEMMDAVTKMIAPYVEKDPTKFCTYEEFEYGIAALKEFSLLRAESVRGQLDGTIASTSEAQKLNSDGFINADGLTISDMGSMNNGMGRGGGHTVGRDQNGDRQMRNDIAGFEHGNAFDRDSNGPMMGWSGKDNPGNSSEDIPDMPDMQGIPDMPNMPGMQGIPGMPDMPNMQGIPGMPNIPDMAGQPSGNENATWILLGVSVGVLLSGLLFAGFYKRRRTNQRQKN